MSLSEYTVLYVSLAHQVLFSPEINVLWRFYDHGRSNFFPERRPTQRVVRTRLRHFGLGLVEQDVVAGVVHVGVGVAASGSG